MGGLTPRFTGPGFAALELLAVVCTLAHRCKMQLPNIANGADADVARIGYISMYLLCVGLSKICPSLWEFTPKKYLCCGLI